MNLSIAIINKNNAHLLNKLITSIKMQTYQLDYELIFVDDFSDDGSANIFLKLVKKYNINKYKIIKNKKTLGQYRTRMISIQNAKNEYIYTVDSDDYFKKDFFKNIVEPLKQRYDIYQINIEEKKYVNSQSRRRWVNKGYGFTANFNSPMQPANHLWRYIFKRTIIQKTLRNIWKPTKIINMFEDALLLTQIVLYNANLTFFHIKKTCFVYVRHKTSYLIQQALTSESYFNFLYSQLDAYKKIIELWHNSLKYKNMTPKEQKFINFILLVYFGYANNIYFDLKYQKKLKDEKFYHQEIKKIIASLRPRYNFFTWEIYTLFKNTFRYTKTYFYKNVVLQNLIYIWIINPKLGWTISLYLKKLFF